jgi:hypothetical protein
MRDLRCSKLSANNENLCHIPPQAKHHAVCPEAAPERDQEAPVLQFADQQQRYTTGLISEAQTYSYSVMPEENTK